MAAPILFSKIDGPFGCMSNFSPHPVNIDGVAYRTSEHFFQAMKFAPSVAHMEQIRAQKSPMSAAMAGRSRQMPLRRDWEAVKDDVMEVAVLCKFTQNPNLRELLVGTGDRMLVEHTPRDKYWGDGMDGGTGTVGKNRLGYLLEKVRGFLSDAAVTDGPIAMRMEELMRRVRVAPAAREPSGAPRPSLATPSSEGSETSAAVPPSGEAAVASSPRRANDAAHKKKSRLQ